MRKFQFSVGALLFLVTYAALAFKAYQIGYSLELSVFDNNILKLLSVSETLIVCFFLGRAIHAFSNPNPNNVFWLGSFVSILINRPWMLFFVSSSWKFESPILEFLSEHPGRIIEALLMGWVVRMIYARTPSERPIVEGT